MGISNEYWLAQASACSNVVEHVPCHFHPGDRGLIVAANGLQRIRTLAKHHGYMGLERCAT
jgi:hypothetical protein